jgi:hypothetical protein
MVARDAVEHYAGLPRPPLSGVGGLMLPMSLPLAQYFVLRDHVRRPALWIPINIAAWLLGIAWTLAPSPVVDQSTLLVL